MNKLRVFIVFGIMMFFTIIMGCSSSKDVATNEDADKPEETIESGETLTLKLGHIATETNPYHLLALDFKKIVETESEGDVIIEVFPNAQLGEERELIEALTFGSLDLAVITSSPVTNFVPEFGIIDIPYLFEDWDHVDAFIESDVAQRLLDETESIGIKTFGFVPRGFRSVTNSKHPVESTEDIKGLTLRVIESEVYLDTINELGATATGMPWGDAFTAMQQGAIDGQENDYSINVTQNVFEVQEFLSLTEHIFAINTLMGSQESLEKLPEDVQELIANAAVEAVRDIGEYNLEQSAELRDTLEENGMKINEVNKDEFMNSVPKTQKKYSELYGEEYYNEIKSLNESTTK